MDEDCQKADAISIVPIHPNNLPLLKKAQKSIHNILYFSDLHLDFKLANNKQITNSDQARTFISHILKVVWKNTLANITTEALHHSIIVVPGDVSFNPQIVIIFFEEFKQLTKEIPIIYVLGNHELWYQIGGESNPSSLSVDEIVDRYRIICSDAGIILLHNDLLCIKNDSFATIMSEDTINNLDDDSFSKTINNCDHLILGGTGFAAQNPIYNQLFELYHQTIHSIEEETVHTNRFLRIFNRVKQAYHGLNPPIIITHSPPTDWYSDSIPSNMIFFHGHTHKNVKTNNERVKIIADCQWGRDTFLTSMGIYDYSDEKDIFESFSNGIYQISSEQYRQFNDKLQIKYDGAQKKIIFMLKKNGYYAFFTKSANNGLQILNGGNPYNVDKNDLGYYYDNLDRMIESINYRISRLSKHLESISNTIKTIGGTGHIHGLIVDIDQYNHIMMDPKTNQIIPYYAPFIDAKEPYRNLRQLLSERRVDLLEKYDLLNKSNDPEVRALCKQTFSVPQTDDFSTNTEICAYSNKIVRLQYIQSHKILREWDEYYISDNTQSLGGNLPTAHSNPAIIPEIIDLSATDYYNSPANIDSCIESIVDSTVQDYYDDYIKKGPFGKYPTLSVKRITIECHKNGVPYDCYDVGSLIENKLAECIDSNYSAFVDFISLASDFIDPLSVSESDIDLLFDYITGLLRCSKFYQECNKKQKTNYNNHIRCDYFLKFLFTPDQIDSFVAELHSRYPDEQQCTKLCFEKIDFFIERSHCHNNRELDNLNHYVHQRLAVTFGKRLDVDQNLREYLQDKVVLDRKDNTFKLNSLYRCFTDE